MTPEQLERLKERRNEIITVAMGKCWHISTDGYYCDKCGAYIIDEDSINFTPRPDYSTPEGWFELYNWLTKENLEWWIKFTERYYAYNTTLLNNWGDDVGIFINNLPDLFVEWLAGTETGWWEDCKICKGDSCIEYRENKFSFVSCHSSGKVLTPLGKLMKEVLDEIMEM